MRRARTLSEFHYNRVFIDATALASEARLHAELRFKLGLPSDYVANWDALVDCVRSPSGREIPVGGPPGARRPFGRST